MPPTENALPRKLGILAARPRPARLGAISDRMLHQLRNVAYDAQRGDATPPEAEMLLAACGPLLDELIAHRSIMTRLASLDCGASNVIPLNS